MTVEQRAARLVALSAARWRVALLLSGAMILVYFGFIALIAFDRSILARMVMPGLSVGILLGVVVIVATWLLTWIYIAWCNRHYDAQLEELRD
jgi:uncharacterized membrane protein (DUF485 family)